MWRQAEKFLLKDKYIGPLIKKYGHCKIRPSNKKDYFIDLVESVVSQQVSGKAADAIYGRLKKEIGVTPQKLAKATTAKLRKAGLSRQKTGYLKDLSKSFIGQVGDKKTGQTFRRRSNKRVGGGKRDWCLDGKDVFDVFAGPAGCVSNRGLGNKE